MAALENLADLTPNTRILKAAPLIGDFRKIVAPVRPGTGDDYLIGDSNLILVGSVATTGTLQAGLEQAADDFDNGVEAYAKKVKGTPALAVAA